MNELGPQMQPELLYTFVVLWKDVLQKDDKSALLYGINISVFKKKKDSSLPRVHLLQEVDV